MKALSQVPVWVWFVMAYGVWMGVRALGKRKVSLTMAALLPLVFFGLSLSSLLPIVEGAPAVGLAWLLTVTLGVCLGWFFLSSPPIEVHRTKGTVVVPGTWTVLVLFLVIFTTKFAYGYLSATRPEVAGQGFVLLVVFGLSGIATGIVTGRTSRLYTRYFSTPVTEE